MRPVRAAVTLLAFLAAFSAAAQTPAADWRTIETPHFRVHYPREYEEWATRAAHRLEPIRDAVSKEIGFVPPQTIDVLVVNPIAQANGVAWPLLDTPRMIFYAEPPAPDEQLGAFGHWIDLLAVHETAHLVHMLRPSRNPLQRALERSVLPLDPITMHAGRWVLEGYATVVEGRLTGAGRPSSTVRALILRRWAESGRLPTYAQLNSDRRFLGMSMAYLMGSAYLEWLEQKRGPDALRNLWSRMTARERRSFDEAFTGVFGDSPDRLYGQFAAELTASAVAIRRVGPLQEGALFQETPRASGEPAVSPDGTQIAVVVRKREQPDELVIWSTAAADEEEKKFSERVKKILERDPEDVAPYRVKPLPRKAVHSLSMPDGGDIVAPRWSRDGRSIVFSHRVRDGEGVLHFDLYRWDFERVSRITTLADVRDADPLPDGRTAIAVRNRFGASQLVTVDLSNGATTPRTEASIDDVFTHPRVSPDGRRIGYVAHRGGRWTLFVDDAAIDVPGSPASPEWLSNEELVVTVFSRGFAELHRVLLGVIPCREDGTESPEGGGSRAFARDDTSDCSNSIPTTRTAGGAFDPAPSPDGRVFFTSLNPDGYVVRVLPSISAAPALPDVDSSMVPAIPPAAPDASGLIAFESERALPSRAYGAGRQELSWFASQNYAPQQSSTELGVRIGDVVGRLDTLVIGALGRNDSPSGVAIATAWRGWPVELHAHAFSAEDAKGLELRGSWTHLFPRSTLWTQAGGLSDDGVSGGFAFGSASYSTRQVRGTTRWDESVRLDVDESHYRAIAAGSLRAGALRFALRYQHDGGDAVSLGGLATSILPRSAYSRRVLDPSLPLDALAGDRYDGWRVESAVPSLPLTAFYQRHSIGDTTLSLAGIEARVSSDPFPVLKLPGLDATIGVARIFDEPFRGETQWWLGVRWRP